MSADGRWDLTLILLTWRMWWAPNNANRWQIRFNSAFKGLKKTRIVSIEEQNRAVACNDRPEGCLAQLLISDRTQFASALLFWRRQPDPVPRAFLCFGFFRRFPQTCEKRQLSFVISVCQSVRPHGTTRPLLEGYSWNLVFEFFFFKSVYRIHVSLKSDIITGALHEHLCAFMIISRSIPFTKRNVSDKKL